MTIQIEVTPGELIDRITILDIKAERIQDEKSRALISEQLVILRDTLNKNVQNSQQLDLLAHELKQINELLWGAENKIRTLERRKSYGSEFIETARAIYKNNDRRHTLKRHINSLLSFSPEVKSYEQY